MRQATTVGPRCAEVVALLLSDRIAELLRAAQAVIGYVKSYGPSRLEAACDRALGHNLQHYRTVKSILATGADLQALVEPETAGPASHAARPSCSAPMRPRCIDTPRRTPPAKTGIDNVHRRRLIIHHERQHLEPQPNSRACRPAASACHSRDRVRRNDNCGDLASYFKYQIITVI